MVKNSDSHKRFPGYMVLPTARKIVETKTILFHNEGNNVEMQLTLVPLSAQSTFNDEWLLHTKVPFVR